MHELAITEGIIEAAIPAAQQNGAKKILEVRLKIGKMSGIVPSCVQDYFAMLSEGTIAEGAKITTEYLPVTIECSDCGFKGEIGRKDRGCPHCGGQNIKITGGSEYYVDSLVVE